MAARYEVRRYYGADNGWQVWDTEENRVAMRKPDANGVVQPAIYTTDKGYTWATKRCESLNTFGATDTGKWQPGGRGRPPKNATQRTVQDYTPKTAVKPVELLDSLIDQVESKKGVDKDTLNNADLDKILDQVKVEIERKTDATAEEIKKSMTGIRDGLAAKVELDVFNIIEMVEKAKEEIKAYKRIEIITDRGSRKLEGRQHFRFEALLRLVNAGVLPLLVGPAGTGKTFAGEQLADALTLEAHAISVGSQTTKSDFLGFIDANGVYRETAFRRAYERGGVFIVDEMDAGNANVLIVLNAALAGTSCAFPDKMVKRHKDFIPIAAANTFGMGANRQYVGRNQLDAATLDRFVPFDWPVDEILEGSLVEHFKHGARWHKVVKAVRKHIDAQAWRVLASPRATIKGAALLEQKFTVNEVIEMTLYNGADAAQKQQINQIALREWGA